MNLMESKESFTSHDDLCGSTLLNLVCQGHILIANVLEASNQIPNCFWDASSTSSTTEERTDKRSETFLGGKLYQLFATTPRSKRKSVAEREYGPRRHKQLTHRSRPSQELPQDCTKYNSILIDFAYLANPEKFDSRNNGGNSGHSIPKSAEKQDIHANAEQERLEREFISIHQDTLSQFHNLFSRIYQFYLDIQSFVDELEQGFYCSYSVESLLQDHCEGRQLLCELLYLYGSVLILVDIYIPVRRVVYFFTSFEDALIQIGLGLYSGKTYHCTLPVL